MRPIRGEGIVGSTVYGSASPSGDPVGMSGVRETASGSLAGKVISRASSRR
jgi:hypothetical protein